MRSLPLLLLFLVMANGLAGQVRWNISDGNVVQTGGYLVLQDASFYNGGTFRATDGYVTLSGSGADALSIIGGDSITTFYGLEVHKSANNALLNQNAIVAFNLNLTGGLLDIINDSLRLLSSATITGASSATYVKTSGGGFLIIPSPADGSAVVFPVGNSAYNPLALANTGIQDTFGVRLRDEILEQNESGNAITENYVNRSWDVFEELAGGSILDVTPQWNGAEELTGFERADASVVRFESTEWMDQMSNAFSGSDPYLITLEDTPVVGSFSVSSAFTCPIITECPTYPTPFYVASNNCVATIAFTRPTLDPMCPNVSLTASITDAPGAAVVTDVSDPDGDYAPGTYSIVWRAFDTNGDERLCSATSFMVLDTISPTISCPADMTVDFNANCELVIPDLVSGTTVNDNCSVVLSQSPIATSVVQNLTDGATQTVTLTATDPSGNTNNTACEVTLTVNNTATVSISDATSANEGDSGTTDFTFTLTRTGPSCAFDVDFATIDGTATAPVDFTANSGTLNFAAGEMTKTVTISVNGDTQAELDETFSVVLSNPTNGVTLDDATGNTTVLNDDIAQFSIVDGATSEGDNGTSQLEIQVDLDLTPLTTVTVDYATSDGTATTSDSDYVAASGTLTFNSGQTTASFFVTINGDTDVELDENLVVNLSNPTGPSSINDGAATIVVNNDDSAILTVEDVSMNEGSSGLTTDFTFTVTLDNAVDGGFELAFTTDDGAATTSNSDYIDADGSLTFSGNAGEQQTIEVNIIHDAVVELDESFSVTLSAISSTPLSSLIDITDGAVGTILNDDAATVSVDANANYAVVEGDAGITPFLIPVQLTGGTVDVDVTVNYTLSDGTATLADNDYADAGTGSVTIPANATGANIIVSILGDTNNEDNEEFTVTITSIDVTGRSVSLGNSTTSITILDDDFVCPTIGGVTGDTGVCVEAPSTLTASGLDRMGESVNNETDFGIRFVYFTAPTTTPYSGGTDLGVVSYQELEAGGTVATLNASFPGSAADLTVYAVLFPTPTEASCRPFQSLAVQVLSCGITNDDDNFPGIDDPCVCKDNATTLIDGQFDELVEVVDAPAGETWTVTQINGLFASSSAAPPAVPTPIAVGFELTELPTGTPGVSNYVLTGIHVDDIGYSVMVSNGTTTLAISNRCWYPNPVFSNLASSYCRTNANVTLMGSAQLGDGSGEATPEMETFTVINLNDNSVVVNDIEGNATLDIANLPAGRYRVIYTFDAADDNPTTNHPGCSQSIQQEFDILDVNCGTFPWGGQ